MMTLTESPCPHCTTEGVVLCPTHGGTVQQQTQALALQIRGLTLQLADISGRLQRASAALEILSRAAQGMPS